MNPTAANTSTDARISPLTRRLRHVPPFSIRYLLAWTGLTAVALLALTRGLNLGVTEPRIGIAVAVIAMAIGWLWFGTLLIVWHAIARRLWRLEPGEWLILTACNAATIWLTLFICHRQLLRLQNHRYPVLDLLAILSFGQCALFCFVAAVAQRGRPGWIAFFAALALLWLSPYAAMLADTFSKFEPWLIGSGIMLFTVSVALLLHAPLDDLLRREPRHWLHYSAMALILMAMVGGIILLGANSRF